MIRRKTAIVRLVPAADYTNYEGYGVTIAAGVATLSASATVPIDGIIVEAGTVAQGVGVTLIGAGDGSVDAKLSGVGPFAQGTKICQAADGTFIADVGTGTARVQVGVLNEVGVAGDLRELFPRTPLILA